MAVIGNFNNAFLDGVCVVICDSMPKVTIDLWVCRFGHLVDLYSWNPHCRYLDGIGPKGTSISKMQKVSSYLSFPLN